MLKAELKNGNLILTIPVNDVANLPLSSSGKTFIVASTNGNTPVGIVVNGQPLVVGLNAYVKNTGFVANGDGAAEPTAKGKNPISGRYGPKVVAPGAVV